jgi:DNA-binding XRE family transcriptional regulator
MFSCQNDSLPWTVSLWHNQPMTAAQLKAFRKFHRWSQREAAEALGMALRSYIRRENGEVPISKTEELAVCAVANGLRGLPKDAYL